MLWQLYEWDRQALFDYLYRNEEDTAFIIGNALHCGITNRGNLLRCGDYFGFFDGNVLKGVIVFYNLGNCIPHFEDWRAVPYFGHLMLIKNFSMLLGPEIIIKPLFDIVGQYRAIREYEECSYCVNIDFKPFKLEGAEFIDVSENSEESILEFTRKAYLLGFGANRNIEGTKLLLSQRSEEEDFIILSKDNKLMAQACIQAYTANTSQIGAVYTPLEERGKGYAKAVVSELSERIINRGKLPTLIVNKQNAPALAAYKALGFEHKSDYLIIRFK